MRATWSIVAPIITLLLVGCASQDDAHPGADLRIVPGGAHHLRHDPRAIAVLLGWLDRQRATLLVERSG